MNGPFFTYMVTVTISTRPLLLIQWKEVDSGSMPWIYEDMEGQKYLVRFGMIQGI
ncbi:hypothetical protein SDC9_42685 [bioreactor metagenome]|uniref:Uncharacterized protein n=1 Tax=bioreactor metagenome TaxID=1076179 RepID=A0A644VYE7_9ZZZZ